MKKIIIFCYCVLSLCKFCYADKIYLKDGTIIKGEIIEKNDTSIKVEYNNKWEWIKNEDIESISKTSKQSDDYNYFNEKESKPNVIEKTVIKKESSCWQTGGIVVIVLVVIAIIL